MRLAYNYLIFKGFNLNLTDNANQEDEQFERARRKLCNFLHIPHIN